MKIVSTVCPNCGASIQVDMDKKNLTCNYCGNSLFVDDEVQHIQYDNAEETGYQFEKGRQRAQAEARSVNTPQYTQSIQPAPKKRKTWLWVLGWIFIFPVPLTILLLRKKDMNPILKYGIIAVAWIFYLIIGFSGKSNDSSNKQSSNDGTVVSTDKDTSNTDTQTENLDVETSENVTVESDQVVSEDPLADFYDEFTKSGTVDNMKEMAKKYGLYVDSRRTGTGRELFKVAETQEEARVTSNDDAYKGDYYVRIECTILGDDTVDSVELVDNRNGEVSDSSEDSIDGFVSSINSSGEVNLEFVEDFVPSDKNSGHYKTEFRLNAYKDAIGKSYKYGDTTVDIILSSSGAIERIYMDGATYEQCENMIRYASPLLDSTATDSDVQEAVDYISENKSANGYYYAKLGLVMLGGGDKGYEFMLKLS